MKKFANSHKLLCYVVMLFPTCLLLLLMFILSCEMSNGDRFNIGRMKLDKVRFKRGESLNNIKIATSNKRVTTALDYEEFLSNDDIRYTTNHDQNKLHDDSAEKSMDKAETSNEDINHRSFCNNKCEIIKTFIGVKTKQNELFQKIIDLHHDETKNKEFEQIVDAINEKNTNQALRQSPDDTKSTDPETLSTETTTANSGT